jgi:hypothetical protein
MDLCDARGDTETDGLGAAGSLWKEKNGDRIGKFRWERENISPS